MVTLATDNATAAAAAIIKFPLLYLLVSVFLICKMVLSLSEAVEEALATTRHWRVDVGGLVMAKAE